MSHSFRPSALALGIVTLFAGTTSAFADTAHVMSTVVVTAARPLPLPANSATIEADDLVAKGAYVSDTATLLGDVPGMSFYGSGGVSSLPAIHGLNDDRVRIKLDGMDLTSACGNHMNPPLSYIDPSNVGSVRILAGITPVSAGGDSIAGTIVVDSKAPEFASDGEGNLLSGRASAYYRSNGDASGGSISARAASETLSVSYAGAQAQRDNYEAGDGFEVKSSKYETQNHALTVAVRGTEQLLTVNVGQQHMPYQGFPNARMDMVKNDATFGNVRYTRKLGWGAVDVKAFYEHTEHEMGFLSDKGGVMPMITDGINLGYLLKGSIHLSDRDTLYVGNEFHSFRLDDFWPPVSGSMMMGPGTFQNINDGERDRIGAFAEWEASWNDRWTTLLGARYEQVRMDSDNVRPYALVGMMQAADITAANAFNARDRERMDDNVDLTLLARYTTDQAATFEAGYARKTRSPNLYERYSWGRGAMAMNMNGWFGDGNGYVGDIDLKPEVAHTLSATASWQDAGSKAWRFSVTPYYTYVKNYIDTVRCPTSLGGACATPNNQTTTNNFVLLQFANHDARLYGVDVSGRLPLAEGHFGRLTGNGVLGYVRGRNVETDDNLYHVMPLNAKLAIDHQLGAWSNVVELQLVAAKDKVQKVRNELKTEAYGLMNLRTSYDWKQVRIDAGIENFFDKNYDLPLGGAYLGDRPMTWGTNVRGMGRNAYVGVTLKF